jgi:hypothetical protein
MDSLLKVVSIDTIYSERSGANFKKVTFKGVKMLGNREVKTNISGTRNLWPTHEVEMPDGTKTTIKGDVDYDNINVDDYFDGSVKTFATTPYQVDGRTINQYRCVVFSHENPLVVAAKNLRQNNAAPLDDDGNAFQLASSTQRVENKKPETIIEP